MSADRARNSPEPSAPDFMRMPWRVVIENEKNGVPDAEMREMMEAHGIAYRPYFPTATLITEDGRWLLPQVNPNFAIVLQRAADLHNAALDAGEP